MRFCTTRLFHETKNRVTQGLAVIQIEFSVQAIKQLFRANIRMNTIQKLHFNKEYYYKYYTRNRDRSCILLLNFSRIVDNLTIIIRCKIYVMVLLELGEGYYFGKIKSPLGYI